MVVDRSSLSIQLEEEEKERNENERYTHGRACFFSDGGILFVL
jgi:hypothetical protein